MPHQRNCRTSHSQQRPRLNRSGLSDRAPTALDKRSLTSVSFQVQNFQLCGELRRTKTEVKNSLPTQKTIETEQILNWFDETRKYTPDSADYDKFYTKLVENIDAHKYSKPGRQNNYQSIEKATHPGDVGTTCTDMH
ncbi:hypothetical protein ElyMa_005722200 [Elysia marginata]|uniref:Uncharacterized protein n=1 Tax=Elysia marginata TaxID=1093978 RepID=A0AAV4FK84_9GAST|nr:hypothetical protein ElyMa_005722200 [Elysia marginata]